MFQGNNASEFGGAVHMESSNATFTGTSFLSNFAKFGAAVETFISEFRVRVAAVANPSSFSLSLCPRKSVLTLLFPPIM